MYKLRLGCKVKSTSINIGKITSIISFNIYLGSYRFECTKNKNKYISFIVTAEYFNFDLYNTFIIIYNILLCGTYIGLFKSVIVLQTHHINVIYPEAYR